MRTTELNFPRACKPGVANARTQEMRTGKTGSSATYLRWTAPFLPFLFISLFSLPLAAFSFLFLFFSFSFLFFSFSFSSFSLLFCFIARSSRQGGVSTLLAAQLVSCIACCLAGRFFRRLQRAISGNTLGSKDEDDDAVSEDTRFSVYIAICGVMGHWLAG